MDNSGAVVGIGTLFKRGDGLGVEGMPLEDFENITVWDQGGTGGSQSADLIYKREGIQSLKHTVPAEKYVTSRKLVSVNFSTFIHLAFWVYVSDHTKCDGIIIKFYTTYPTDYYYTASYTVSKNGWNRIVFLKSGLSHVGSPSWASINSFVVETLANADGAVWVCWDDLRYYAPPNTYGAETFTDLGEVTSIGFGPKKAVIDVTHLASPDGWREYKSLFKDGAQLTLSMNLTIDAYEQLFDDYEEDDPHNYQIVLSDDEQTTLTFSLHVTDLPLNVKLDDKITLDVTFKITGGVEWS